jgi:catechol 2,3-dioxygenase-like lactoylglutathione lyase family enzyme
MKTRGVELKSFLLGADGFALQLVEYVSGAGEPAGVAHPSAGTVHLAINIDDLDAKHQAVLASGKYDPTPIVEQPLPGVRSFYAFDPDGVPVEFVTGPYAAETTSYTD